MRQQKGCPRRRSRLHFTSKLYPVSESPFMADQPDGDEYSTAAKKSDYNADDLSSLKGLEAVRKKPGMYIGGTDERALHHCVSEVLDNSVDEFLAGYCSHIDVTIHSDGSISIRDNGRGIPVDINK